MLYLNYGICVLGLAVLVGEVWFVLKRNRKIRVKGKDDFFSFTVIVLFLLALMPLSQGTSLLESFRNVVVLMAAFGTLSIKRGISDQGVEKVFFTVPWNQIREIRLDAYQTQKMVLVCQTDKIKWKLYFHRFQLRDVLYQVQKYHPEIMMDPSLEEALKFQRRR